MSVEEKYKDIKSKLGSKTVSVDYRYLSADHQHRLDIMVDDVLFKSFLYILHLTELPGQDFMTVYP